MSCSKDHWLLDTVCIHQISNELWEFWLWLCHDDSTINIVMTVTLYIWGVSNRMDEKKIWNWGCLTTVKQTPQLTVKISSFSLFIYLFISIITNNNKWCFDSHYFQVSCGVCVQLCCQLSRIRSVQLRCLGAALLLVLTVITWHCSELSRFFYSLLTFCCFQFTNSEYDISRDWPITLIHVGNCSLTAFCSWYRSVSRWKRWLQFK